MSSVREYREKYDVFTLKWSYPGAVKPQYKNIVAKNLTEAKKDFYAWAKKFKFQVTYCKEVV